MRAAIVHSANDIRVTEVDTPSVHEGTVLVRIAACAICGSDLRILSKNDRRARYPQIIGHELAGTVVEVGQGTGSLSVGDRVTVAPGVSCGSCYYCQRGLQNLCDHMINVGYNYPGGFAEYMLVPREAIRGGFVNKIPESVSLLDGALAEPLACCINGQDLCRVTPEDTVTIIGAGPLGCMNAQLAKARGVKILIICQRSPGRLALARRFGADVLVDTGAENAVERVLAETGGRGSDVVIVACASGEAQREALRMVAKRGRVNFFGGLPHGDSMTELDANLIHYKECFVCGSNGSTGLQNQEALRLLGDGAVPVGHLITHRFTLPDIASAFEVARNHQGLKVVIEP